MLDFSELHAWLDTHTFSRQKKNLNRDFSDGVLLAELLKNYYPNLVELHNYSPQNSMSRKLENWEVLNRKVLKKLRLGISNRLIEQVVSAQPGAIEKILLRVKHKVEQKNNQNLLLQKAGNESDVSDEMSEYSGPSIKIPVKIKNGSDEIMIVEQNMTADTIAKKFDELEEKTEAIKILNQKVEHLDCLIRLKDQRIQDLAKQLQKYHSFGQIVKNLTITSKTNLSDECD